MKWLFLFFAMVLTVFSTACVSQKSEVPSSRLVEVKDFDSALLAREIFNESNRARQRLGARKLTADSTLDRVAEKQATMMSWELEVSHYNPLLKNKDPYARVAAEGLSPGKVAENAANLPLLADGTGRPRTYGELAAAFVQTWLDSPGHRFNLLYPDFKFLGCAARVALVPRDGALVYASQVFLTPAPDAAPAASEVLNRSLE